MIDDDPAKAISEALELSGNINFELLKAAILIDAGAFLKNYDAVFEGVEIYRNAVSRYQDNSEFNSSTPELMPALWY